jgi:hypothetical protein
MRRDVPKRALATPRIKQTNKQTRSAANHRMERSDLDDELEFEQLFISSVGLLFTENQGALVSDPDLNRAWLRKIVELLDTLRLACGDYAKLAAEHDDEYRAQSPFVNSPSQLDFTLGDFDLPSRVEASRTSALIVENDSSSNESVLRKFDWRWALFEKKKLKTILKTFQGGREKLKVLLQLMVASNSKLSNLYTYSNSTSFQTDANIQALGLAPHIQIRQLDLEGFPQITRDIGRLDRPSVDGELVPARLHPTSIKIEDGKLDLPSGQSGFIMARYHAAKDEEHDAPENVIVEFKTLDEESSPSDEERILQLGRLLAASRDSDLCILPIRHIIRHGPNNSYAFVFGFPPLTLESTPVSLHDLIQPNVPSHRRLSLHYRFHIAQNISKSLAAFHADNWVHKSFRSRSIIFFHSQLGQLRFMTPYLTNFEYSRATTTDTSWTYDGDAEKNLYRHPDRQRPPTISFNKLHDLWSLGVVLLEIGLWQTAQSIREQGLQTRSHLGMTNDPHLLKGIYLERTTTDLPHMMGPAYAQAVETCLNWDFGCGAADPKLTLEFYERVIQKLDIKSLSTYPIDGT